MLAPQRPPTMYPVFPYGNHAYRTTSFRTTLVDVNWFDTWPTVRSILLACMMVVSSAAIVGLDIANLAIEGSKQDGTSALSVGPAKVGAGIWSGSISFLAAIFILVIVCVKNKRIAATFALIAITLAFFFTIVLVGLVANTIHIYQYPVYKQSLEIRQWRLLIAILSIALFNIVLHITFFLMYITVFFSSFTRQSAMR